MKTDTLKIGITSGILLAFLSITSSSANNDQLFNRIATFPVYLNSKISNKTVAEIFSVSKDNNTLIYTDGEMESIGFVSITDPANPVAAGFIAVGGELTSLAVSGKYALVVVNTSENYINVSGNLLVVDITSHNIVATHPLAGQPDSIAVSPDGRYAAIAIENERNEKVEVNGVEGGLPQFPAGLLQIIDLGNDGMPLMPLRNVILTGLTTPLYPQDPEPEYVDINKDNIAVLALQENNAIVLIDLATAQVIKEFNAGSVDLEKIDTKNDGLITLNNSLQAVLREPDGITWLNGDQFATANEGDLNGGSRGFSIFDMNGSLTYDSANSVEHTMVRYGHFPENRAGKKGNETENVEFGHYQTGDFLFVGSERSSVVLVYKQASKLGQAPKLMQVLPTAVKPEGLLAIPGRNLFIAAGEKDARDDKIRSALSIYRLEDKANYPSIISKNTEQGTPIAWGALSGLAIDNKESDKAYAVQDNSYKQSTILQMNLKKLPAKITKAIKLSDSKGLLKEIKPELVNSDLSVNLDLEGISTRKSKGFWVVSEGSGAIEDNGNPLKNKNLLLKIGKKGAIKQVVSLPETVNNRQVSFGFEGVSSVEKNDKEAVFVVFQREWQGDKTGHVRIGRYDTQTEQWRFLYYPLDKVESNSGSWIGLSDIAYVGNDQFAVLERDNQSGADAKVKRIYQFSVTGMTLKTDDGSDKPNFEVVSKTLVRDLIPDLKATGGLVLEKLESLAVTKNGTAYVINDNNGVEDTNGETQLIRLEKLFPKQN